MWKDLIHHQLSPTLYKERNKEIEKEKKKLEDEANEKKVSSGMTSVTHFI